MPELPEVETVRRILENKYVGKRIIDISILYPKMIHSPLEEFKKNIIDQIIISVTRKGKYLFINFSNGYSLISHLRMEGKYVLREKDEELSKYTKVIFYLDDNTLLCYEDMRCFGVMYLCQTQEIFNNKEVGKLGPEPFEIKDSNYLYNKYQKSNKEIKTCLLDQEIMSGLGNIYCDEVLFKSKINPFRKASTLSLEECQKILDFSIETLNKAISLGGSTVSSYHPEKGIDGKFQNELNVYGRASLPCPICHTILRKDKISGRGTTYCPICQNVALSVGLTGKIASGKSSVLDLFKEKGAKVFSCDEEVNNLYKDIEFKKLLIDKFSSLVLNDDLSISKGYLKNLISNDPTKKKELEDIIHPLIKEKVVKFIHDNKLSSLIVVEVPLLFETKMNSLFDYTIGVSCSLVNQIEHLKNRGSKNINLDLDLNNSNQFDKYAKKCSFLISNDSSFEELKKQVDVIYLQITSNK